MKNYSELIVWRKAMRFVTYIYRTTKSFPEDERYELTAQLKRSSVSLLQIWLRAMAEIQHKIMSEKFCAFVPE